MKDKLLNKAERPLTHYLDDSTFIEHVYRDCPKIHNIDHFVDANKFMVGNDSDKYSSCSKCDEMVQRDFYKGVTGMLCFLTFFPLVLDQLGGEPSLRQSTLWIYNPPSGKPFKMSYYQALRIIRKQGWRIAETRPAFSPWRWIDKWKNE